MVLFSKESLETLKQRVDLVEVLSAHIEFKRTGAAYKALCPFHDEKTPSFSIQKGDKHYHCFGCGAHGDAIQFLMTHLKLSFSDAVENLAQRFHVSLEKVEGISNKPGPNKNHLKEALDQASRFYHFMLLHTQEGHAALDYLFKRGLDLEFIKYFQIGLAPAASGMLRKVMHDKSIKDDIMVEAGLLQVRDNGSYRDFFSDRITFPVQESSGAIIGFSARKYKEETFGGKYINTSETALFKKSRILFGLNFSRRRIAKERKAIIVEGQIDALRLIHAGLNFTVAGQGTAFGEGHVKELINLGVNQVYLALDGDTAGQEATCKIGNFFQREGVEARVVQMPSGSDPDAFLRQYGPEKFVSLLESSIDYLSFLVKYYSRNLNMESPAGKNELIQELAKQIRSWQSPVMVHESLRKLAQLTQTPEEIIGVGQEHIPNIYIKKTANIGLQTIDPNQIMEADVLRWMLLMGQVSPALIGLVQSNLKAEDFKTNCCKQFYQTYINHHEQKEPFDLLTLAIHLEDAEGQSLLSDLTQKKVNKERAEQHLVEAIQRMLDRNWMQQREELRIKIQGGSCSDEEALLLVQQFGELNRNQPKVKVTVK